MLQIVDQLPTFRGRLSRRVWLQLGLAGGAGLLNPRRSVRAEAQAAGFGRAKTVLFVVTGGGQSQLETWDPKPEAPSQVRGEFGSIETAIPGVRIGEHLPKMAKLLDRCALIRTMSHEDLDHGSAVYLTLTGFYHRRRSGNPPPAPIDRPTLGALFENTRHRTDFVRSAVHLNGPILVPTEPSPGQNAGFLGPIAEPLQIGDVTAAPVAVPGLESFADLPEIRLTSRQTLLSGLDRFLREAETRQLADQSGAYRQAFDLLHRPACRRAFELESEPDNVRDQYGRHRTGQACLLARRLVEAGAPWITLFWNHSVRGQDDSPNETDLYGWDTHNDIFYALKNHLLPRFDQSFSTLLSDLADRGLLDTTLVVCAGEFGRAPLVALEPNFAGSSPGRKHWASCYSVLAAGAGVHPGLVVGRSDRRGAFPESRGFGPWDLAATMFSAAGIAPESTLHDGLQRPFPLCEGAPITELYTG